MQAEIRADSDKKVIQGYAARFNSLSELLYGQFKEVIRPGAFSQSLQNNDIRALFEHNSAYVLGRNKAGTLKLSEDEQGLAVEIEPPQTAWAKDLIQSIERGDINQMSFGFRVNADKWTQKGSEYIRELTEIDLFEVSVVTFPAYTETSISIAKRNIEALQQKVPIEIYRMKLDLKTKF